MRKLAFALGRVNFVKRRTNAKGALGALCIFINMRRRNVNLTLPLDSRRSQITPPSLSALIRALS